MVARTIRKNCLIARIEWRSIEPNAASRYHAGTTRESVNAIVERDVKKNHLPTLSSRKFNFDRGAMGFFISIGEIFIVQNQ